MVGLVSVTPPSREPLTLEEVKLHLRVDNTLEDSYLEALITTARMTAENTLKRKLLTQTWKQYHDRFPCGTTIELFLPPLISITSVQYIDTDGAIQTLASSKYTVSTSGERGRIVLKEGESWPDIALQMPDAVCITMVVGYGSTAAAVPTPIKQGMLLLIGHYYNMREDVIVGTIVSNVPKTSEYLWTPYISREF